MLQLNSKNIPYQSVQVFLSLVSKSSDIATKKADDIQTEEVQDKKRNHT